MTSPRHRGFDHVTMVVVDLDEARRFFGLLGFEETTATVVSGDEMSRYMGIPEWEADHVTMALVGAVTHQEVQLLRFHHPTLPDDPAESNLARLGINHVCFAVDDLDATLAVLEKAGVRTRNEVMDFHDRRLVFLVGPGHITIELAEWKAAATTPKYVVTFALQRGPYPYERRTAVVAALDAASEAESERRPDGWVKAVKRAYKEGGEVRTLRIAIEASEVAELFGGPAGARAYPHAGHYNVRLALCQDVIPDTPPVAVAALDEEMAESMGIDLAGPLMAMPMFYRRQVARAMGEVREIIVSVPRPQVDAVFEPPAVGALVCHVLSAADPRF